MKKSNRDKLNLFFSAFLIIGYIICSYFFMTLASRMTEGAGTLVKVVVFILFGLLVFYATRVGEGVPVKRFSPIILCVLVIPSLFIIFASIAPAFPFHAALASQEYVMLFACVALGYGIPYTFLSGFELMEEEEEEDDEFVDGGLAQELFDDEDDDETEDEDEVEIDDDEESVEELEELDGAKDAE